MRFLSIVVACFLPVLAGTAHAGDCDVDCKVASSIVGHLSKPRFDPFVEHPLPVAANESQPAAAPCSVLRCFETAGTRWELYASGDVDLVLSLPVDGLWLRRIEAGGAQRSFYLGLKRHRPFALAPSDRPLIADGELHLAMRRDEVVRESIVFPTDDVKTRRDGPDIELRAPLADIMRDTDGDGLTDILERQLLLDPDNADSDGDGVRDGVDPLPNVPFTPAETPRQRVFARLLTHVLNLDRPDGPGRVSLASKAPSFVPRGELTLYLMTDPSDAAALASEFRIVVFAPTSLGALQRDGAAFSVFYPVTFKLELDEKRGTGQLEYTVALSGGTLKLKFEQGDWIVVDKSKWVI